MLESGPAGALKEALLKTVLITGADRGVGFALAECFLKEGWMVFAGRFMPEWGELEKLKARYGDSLYLAEMDVSDEDSVAAARGEVAARTSRLDMLVNNAGISGGAGDIFALGDLSQGLCIFNVNSLGPLRVTEAFLPLMEDPGGLRRLCFVSSEAGSVSVCHRDEGFIYPMSKTALNMAVMLLYKELSPRGFSFRLYHPGWVRSYMSGKKSTAGKFEPEETAASALRFFTQARRHEDVLHLVDNEGAVWPF
jgi:NAD(P)-dependent dehydrogenase (short-subunit alcohol dehydrogenase family)